MCWIRINMVCICVEQPAALNNQFLRYFMIDYAKAKSISVLPSIPKAYWPKQAFSTQFPLMWEWDNPIALMWLQAQPTPCPPIMP